jgi:hypothetical protein
VIFGGLGLAALGVKVDAAKAAKSGREREKTASAG